MADQPSGDLKADLTRVVSLHYEGRDREALKLLELVSAHHKPSGFPALLIACAKSITTGSRRFVENAAAEVCDSVPGWVVDLMLGSALFGLGRGDDGLSRLRKAAGASDHFLCDLALGFGLMEKGTDFLEAAVRLDRGSEHLPDEPLVLTGLGRALSRCGLNRCAIRALEAADRLEPDDPEVQWRLGFALAGDNRAREAIAAYQRYSELRPEHTAHARAAISDCYLRLGNPEAARQAAEEALAGDPGSEVAAGTIEMINNRESMGVRCLGTGMVDAACDLLGVEAEREDPPGLVRLHLGVAQALRDKHLGPLEEAAEAVRGNVPEDQVLEALGSAKWDLSMKAEGIRDLRRAVALCPTPVNVSALAGCLVTDEETRDEAARLYMELANQEEYAVYAKCGLARASRDPSESLRLLEETIQQEPTYARYHFEMGSLGERLDDYAAALSAYSKALDLEWTPPLDAVAAIARCWLALGEREWASRIVQIGLREDPAHQETHDVRQRIDAAEPNG